MSASHRFLMPNLAHKLVKRYRKHSQLCNIQHNYNATLRRLRKKVQKEKLRVIFYTNEPQKWSYEFVYRKFENSPYFFPIVVVVPRYRVHEGSDDTRMTLEEQYQFYKDRGYNVEYGYIDGKYLDISTFSPDIFFYMQLAEIPNIDHPAIVSKYALTCYCPYGYSFSDYKKQYLQDFHRLLWTNFVEHELTIERYEQYKRGNSKNCIATGYPKLDAYTLPQSASASKYWKNPEKYKIIYAPHHSFSDNEHNLFRWGTFDKNYSFILSLAKKHPETTWIFKPHPMLRSRIVTYNLMTEQEADAYYEEWGHIGNIYDTGDYMDIFRTSNLMITDSGSFLAEYLPSGNPLIRLINDSGIALNNLGVHFSQCFYNTHNNNELMEFFENIVVCGDDPLKKHRCEMATTLVDKYETASDKIYKYITEKLNIQP